MVVCRVGSMVTKHQDEVVRCVAAYLQDEDLPDSGKLAELYLVLCNHAGRVLRRHGLRSVEPADAVTEVLFPSSHATALRSRLLEISNRAGLAAAVAYLLGAVNNGVWRLHAELDPVGARAFRSLRVALRLLREGLAGPKLDGDQLFLGEQARTAAAATCAVADLLQTLAQRAEFVGMFALRCHRALGTRLAQLLAALDQHCQASGQRLEVGIEALTATLVGILRERDSQELKLVALGRGDLLWQGETAPEGSRSWPFAEIESGAARVMAQALQMQLGQARLGQKRLYASRQQRLLVVVTGWLAVGNLQDPLEQLLSSGISVQVAYEDRSLLAEALRAEIQRLLPALCSA
jgi:hypothetical protein